MKQKIDIQVRGESLVEGEGVILLLKQGLTIEQAKEALDKLEIDMDKAEFEMKNEALDKLHNEPSDFANENDDTYEKVYGQEHPESLK